MGGMMQGRAGMIPRCVTMENCRERGGIIPKLEVKHRISKISTPLLALALFAAELLLVVPHQHAN